MARLKYWVWLSCIGGVRPWAKYRLCEALGGPDRIFFGEEKDLAAVDGIQSGEIRRLMDKSMDRAGRAVAYCLEHNIEIITIQDAEYPERLRNIPDPPVVLYIRGKLPPVDDHTVLGVVGTRKATPYGIRMAGKIGRELGEAGAIVVSGLAEGCDSAAMEGALLVGGTSIGVLGTAINEIYPAKNRKLFDDVRTRGALVSEYPPEMRTYPADFKARNRIITGLSLGVVVAEAPVRSGTRNTVEHALEQGRDVFAVPGNADAAACAGCNDLIAQGAVVATCGEDVLREYAGRYDLVAHKPTAIPIKKEIDKPRDIVYIDADSLEGLPTAQRKVLRVMTRPDMHADEIIEAVGMSAAETLAALTMLQVTGYIDQGAGRRYTRKK